jgi:hypothetical protein
MYTFYDVFTWYQKSRIMKNNISLKGDTIKKLTIRLPLQREICVIDQVCFAYVYPIVLLKAVS